VVGQSHAAQVEPDHPAERGQPTLKARHAALVVDAVDRHGGAREHQQVHRAVAENLVGDVYVAALGVAGFRRGNHGMRLALCEAVACR